jgi:O-antigen/teichoic acid export membrane protein
MLDKLKSLSKDTLTYGVSTMVSRFLNFILVPFYTNFLPPEEYGIVANVFAYIAILNVLFSIGMESGYFKFASTLEVGNKKQNFSHPFIAVFFNALILSSIIFLFPGVFEPIFQTGETHLVLIKYVALILFFDAIVLVPFAYLRLNNKAKVFAIYKVINVVINVVMNLVLIIGFNMGIEAILVSNVIASFATFILLLPLILKNLEFSFNKELFSELVRFSLPYIPAGISANIIQVINRPLLLYLTDDRITGIFTANYKLGIIMMLFVTIFDFAWRPFFLNNAKDPNAKQLFAKVMTLFIAAGGLICIATSSFLPEIIRIFGEEYREGYYVVPFVLLAYLFNGIYVNLMPGIYFEKKTKYLPLITGISAAVNIGANFALIPSFGMLGAALATLLSYIAMAAGIYITAQKFYPIRYEYGKIFFIFISLLSSYGFFLFLQRVMGVHWVLGVAGILTYVILVFALRVFDVRLIKKLISGRV